VPTGQALDLVMAAVLGTVRALVGEGWEPLSASFSHPAPADPAPYHHWFGPWVRFGQDRTGLVFHTRDLDLPVLVSDPSLRPYTQRLLRSLGPPPAPSITVDTATAVERLLPVGRASADQVSRSLGMSPRQLQRALAQDGETFSGVVDNVRAGLAERSLSAGRSTLTELSQQLGFAAPSALSRWFRQHFGTNPSAWRDALAPADGTAPPALPGGTPPRPSGVARPG
jgi:AraC-like DNA-binding protein